MLSNLRGTAERLSNSNPRNLVIGLSLFLIVAFIAVSLSWDRLVKMLHPRQTEGIPVVETPASQNNLYGFSSPTQSQSQIETALASWTNPALIIPTALPIGTPMFNLIETIVAPAEKATFTISPTVTSTYTPNLTSTSAVSLSLTASPFAYGTCGHGLDIAFGSSPSLIIHVLEGGESLNMYADKYQTTTDAILAINYHLAIPVKPGRAIVIPIGPSSVSGLPAFDLFQTDGTISTTEELAVRLGASPQLLGKYNALVEPCRAFLGWVLIPHLDGTPTP